MKIFVYNAAAQTKVGAQTAPQDYLHIAINDNGQFAIFVWDTRAIVEAGKTECKDFAGCKAALDNLKQLKGAPEGFDIKAFNIKTAVPAIKGIRYTLLQKADGTKAAIRNGHALDIQTGQITDVTGEAKTIKEYLAKNTDVKEVKASGEDKAAIAYQVQQKFYDNNDDLFKAWFNK